MILDQHFRSQRPVLTDQPDFAASGLSHSLPAVQNCLDRLSCGETGAANDLLKASIHRLRLLARKILADIPAVKRWDNTDDLLQNASLRLWRAVETHRPPTPADYFRLAACVMRRELIDLSRSHFGPLGWGANQRSPRDSEANGWLAGGIADETHNPERLQEWEDFHNYVEALPEGERQLFDCLWYQGLTMAETSEVLKIPLRSLGRAWKMARVKLAEALQGTPGDA